MGRARGFLNHVDPLVSDLEYSNGNYASASVVNKICRKKRKGVVDNDHAKKKHRMAAMSERSLKEVSEGKPLYDEHISFAQKLLQQQFPMFNGQQSPLLSQNSGFCPVKDDKFITQGRGL